MERIAHRCIFTRAASERPVKGNGTYFSSHTWASWHRQAGTSCDELKELGGWKSREMVDRYAKYATEHLAVAATRIERVRAENVGNIVTFASRSQSKKDLALRLSP